MPPCTLAFPVLLSAFLRLLLSHFPFHQRSCSNALCIFLLSVIIFQRPSSTQHGDTLAAFIIHPINKLNQSNLPGLFYMRGTACTNIISGVSSRYVLDRQPLLAPVFHLRKLILGRISHQDIQIFKNSPVCFPFNFL